MSFRPLFALPAVGRARVLARTAGEKALRQQLELVRIPAPTHDEGERGERVRALLNTLGVAEVRTDEVGNVTAAIPAAAPDGGGPVVLAAHLDTVFPAGTELEPRHDGERIYAPGIADNARGLAGMLAVARAVAESGVRMRRPVVFAATVGEEGAGDLRGVKHLFRPDGPLRGASAFVALDGSGLRRIVHRAIGSRRLRVSVRGAGGHSWADRGTPNPVHALGRAVSAIAALAVPPRSALTVARIGGGTSINTIPAAAWMEIDLRSEVPEALAALEREVRRLVAAALEDEGRGDPALEMDVDVIGDRPSGETPADAPLVRAAAEATRAVGERPELVASSTDANLPISLGVPAIAIGVGGESGGIHTTEEWYADARGALGIERALLVALAAAGVARSE